MEDNIGKEILDVLLKYANKDKNGGFEYINPYFLREVSGSVLTYFGLENDIVDDWVDGMFSA